MFPPPTPLPRHQPGHSTGRSSWQSFDNSVNNYGNNYGSMAGGSINIDDPVPNGSHEPRITDSGFDQAGFGVFINYRRSESRAATIALLHRELAHHFGVSRVFLDRSSMEPGARYPDRLWLGLNASRVVLSVIHPGWLDELWQRQASPGKDWVEFEIETALKAQKVLIPVLLDGVSRLKPEQLPASIRDLAHRTAARLRLEQHDDDLARLVRSVAAHLRK